MKITPLAIIASISLVGIPTQALPACYYINPDGALRDLTEWCGSPHAAAPMRPGPVAVPPRETPAPSETIQDVEPFGDLLVLGVYPVGENGAEGQILNPTAYPAYNVRAGFIAEWGDGTRQQLGINPIAVIDPGQTAGFRLQWLDLGSVSIRPTGVINWDWED